MNNKKYFGIKDVDFIRGNIPMTKEEIRVVTISKLRLNEKDVVLDIGAGTGSISVETAGLLKEGIVYSVEMNPEGIDLIKKNCEKFNIKNIKIIEGKAPEALKEINKIDKIIIGGSGGNLSEIIKWGSSHLNDNGRIVINAITFDTLSDSMKFLEENNFSDIEIIQVCINRFEEIGNSLMLKPLNPVFIISATKEN
jgi:cobalt-precorrin-6B (C15)-methyltransferase